MGVKENTYKYAIKNAWLHNGKADINAVIAKVIALEKEIDVKKAIPVIQEVVKEVNSIGIDEIKAEYEKFEKEGYELKPTEKKPGLSELDWAAKEKVVTRFAPNPNGPFHLGNARAAIVSHEYARKYNGKFILRFDDTDPKVKKPIENAEWLFKEDLNWIGCKADKTYFASARLEIYYKFMRKAIELGKVYVCNCKPDDWKKLVSEKKGCPCREKKPKEVMQLFEKMLKNELKEGEAVLRIKTDLMHPDPSIRDWWAAKIVDKPMHPRVKDKHVWPSYNFASAIDDHELGITLIVRGQEHSQNKTKQEYLYKYLGWVYPHCIHFGRVKLEGVILSTSKIKEGIENGEFIGWDDPRLGTIRAFRRRGFDPRALKEAIMEIGAKTADTTIEWSKLIDLNKKYIDSESIRLAFMQEPIRLDVQYAPEIEISREGKGYKLQKGSHVFLVPKQEIEAIKEGEVVRLRQAYNIKIIKKDPLQVFAEFTGTAKIDKPIISWILQDRAIDVELIMPDAKKKLGLMEEAELKKGQHIYLERFGYAVVDEIGKGKAALWFTHK